MLSRGARQGGGMDADTNFSPLIASVVSIQPEEFEGLEQLERG